MQAITILDGGISNATRLFFLLIGLWGLWRAVRGNPVDGSYLGALAVGELLFVVMLLFDLILWFGEVRPQRTGLHYLYAVFAVLLLPFIYSSVLRADDSNRAQWIYAFVTLFLFGIADRAIATAI